MHGHAICSVVLVEECVDVFERLRIDFSLKNLVVDIRGQALVSCVTKKPFGASELNVINIPFGVDLEDTDIQENLSFLWVIACVLSVCFPEISVKSSGICLGV